MEEYLIHQALELVEINEMIPLLLINLMFLGAISGNPIGFLMFADTNR